jgi:hypothetical protein
MRIKPSAAVPFFCLMWINAAHTSAGDPAIWTNVIVGRSRRGDQRTMINRDINPAVPARTVDPLVFSSAQAEFARAEFMSVCERLTYIWAQRAQVERDLLVRLTLDLAKAPDISQALRVYSDNASQRMRIVLENAQRLFDEQQRIAERFSDLQDSEIDTATGGGAPASRPARQPPTTSDSACTPRRAHSTP